MKFYLLAIACARSIGVFMRVTVRVIKKIEKKKKQKGKSHNILQNLGDLARATMGMLMN